MSFVRRLVIAFVIYLLLVALFGLYLRRQQPDPRFIGSAERCPHTHELRSPAARCASADS